VPDEVHAAAAARVVIPVAARSLNIVTAAAIGLAEALRQVDGFPAAPHQAPHV
jgi:tRNA (cytidine/uridine-2'-O-)-methyltransferase